MTNKQIVFGSLKNNPRVNSSLSLLNSLFLKKNLETTAKYNSEDPEWSSPVKDDFEPDTEITANENKEEIIKKAKAGWTIKNSESVRIGDLYLMVIFQKYLMCP